MTVATQSESARQKLEAENFLRRVQTECPHLLVLGWQAILNASVHGMRQIGVYNDNLTEATFLAGLRHSMDSGVVPKPPQAVAVPAQPSAEELAGKAETERLAELGRQREEADNMLRSQQSNPSRNNYEGSPSLLDGAKKAMDKIAETRAKAEAETMRVYNANGTINHSKSEQLQKIFVNDKATGAVLWQQTWAARKVAARNAEQQAKNKRNNSF